MRGGRNFNNGPGESAPLGDGGGPGGESLAEKGSPLWEDFSYVTSSRHREVVMRSLTASPKLPRQISEEADLRPAHVSRSLRELGRRGLVECLTPLVKARGRLYAITDTGMALFSYMDRSNERFAPAAQEFQGFVRKIRATAIHRCLAYLKRARGEAAVKEALADWTLDMDGLREDTWMSVEAFDEFLQLLETRFGDGSYTFIRNLFVVTTPMIPSIKEQIIRPIPLEALAERAPIVYSKEWNYGRLEVRVGRRSASFLHYEWMPTQAMCAMFHGVYEGVLKARGVEGSVRKSECVRAGSDFCQYDVEW